MAEFEYEVGQEALDTAEGQRAPVKPTEPGIYEAVVNRAYIRKTDSGAEMAEIELQLDDDKKLFYSTCVRSRAGKTTYTSKDGKEIALPGVNEILSIFKIATGEKRIKVEKGMEEVKDKPVEVLRMPSLNGKKFKIGVRNEQYVYNGEVKTKPTVIQWMDLEGRNEKGEPVESSTASFIERNPVKKPRGEAIPTSNPAADKEKVLKSGW